MQAAPARYVSVSELYSTDEVELLLDEIRELEPTSCRGEDVQDFEIAGSGCGGGGRSPAGTELTEHSWDSHAHYTRLPPPRPRPLAPLYCDLRLLLRPHHAATLLLIVSCVCSCGCLWSSGWVAAARVRTLHLAALSSLLLHAALLFAHVSHLHALMPIRWDALALVTGAWSAASLGAGATLALYGTLAAPESRRPAPHTAALLTAAAGLGLGGALCAALLVGALCRLRWAGGLGGLGVLGVGGGRSSRASVRAAYRAVPTAPQPSTSRDHAL